MNLQVKYKELPDFMWENTLHVALNYYLFIIIDLNTLCIIRLYYDLKCHPVL